MNILCKLFNLIKRRDIVFHLSSLVYKMSLSKNTLKRKYDNGDISEWEFYKRLWNLRGRLAMLEDVVNLITKRGV